MDYKKQLEEFLDHLVAEGGSDLHFTVGRVPTIRVSGFLIPLVHYKPLTKEDTKGLMTELLRSADRELFLKNREIDFSYQYKDRNRFRGNCYFEQGNIAIALRLIPRKIKTFAELNLPPILESFANLHQGFFLVVGPMGHGKSTTLAAIIEFINQTRSEHIITIEDPIEYVYEPKLSIINQREVRTDTDDFSSGLVSTFREDANVILLGEMRDPKTIATAVTAAETGHLVFSTLHTNNASQAIDRIIDSFPAGNQDQVRVQLAGSLSGILSQRLVPRISGGLIPAFELLINNTAVANLIRDKRIFEIDTVIETSSQSGMITLNRSLADLIRRGEITAENAYLYSLNPKELEKII